MAELVASTIKVMCVVLRLKQLQERDCLENTALNENIIFK